MSKQLKALAGAFLVVLAMAVSASPASAAVANFASEKYPSTLSGTQTAMHVFGTKAGEIKCNVAKLSGTLGAKSTTVTVSPTYENCTLNGAAMAVAIEGCTYKLEAGNMKTETEAEQGGLEILCAAGKAIKFTWNECVIRFLPTTESQGWVDYANIAGGELEAKVNIAAGLKHHVNNKCGVPEGESELGSLKGNYKIKGSNGWVKVIE